MYKEFKRAGEYEWYGRLFKRGPGNNSILTIEEAQKLTTEEIVKIKEDIEEFAKSIQDIRLSHREEHKELIKELEEVFSKHEISYKNHKGTHLRWFKSLYGKFKHSGSHPGNFRDIICGTVGYKGKEIYISDMNFGRGGISIQKIIDELPLLIKKLLNGLKKKKKNK